MTLWQIIKDFFCKPKTTTTTTTNTIKDDGISKKRSLWLGINNYPGTANDLRGCVNDSNEWSKLVRDKFRFDEVLIVNDKQAVKKNLIDKWDKLVSKSKIGDTLVFGYSGHGTTTPDRGEKDEVDGKDEAICLYDSLLIDDELRAMLDKVPKGVKLIVVIDSCHSGTVTRAFLNTMSDNSFYSKPRFIPPENDLVASSMDELPLKKRLGYSEEGMNHILLTGTNSTTYSYDAYIGGKHCGAFSHYAIEILKANSSITFNDFYEKLKKKLPSNQYPQYPQLEGPESLKNTIMFE